MIAPLFLDAASGLPALLVWAIDTLVVTTLLVLMVIAVRKPVARHFGPEIAYLLWAIPAARLLLPPLPQLLPSLPTPTGAPAEAATVMMIDAAAAAPPSLVEQAAAYIPASWPWLLLALWLGGAAVSLAWQALVHRRLLAALDDAELVEHVGRIRVYISDAVSGPVSFGLIDPVIVLPSQAILPLTPAEQRLAIAHELAHHQRGDLWANAFAVVFAALHWFNPLVRRAWANFRFDQEAACDACVLATTGRDARGTYARTLAKAASGHMSAFASPMVAPDRLKERLTMMIQPDHSKARRRLGVLLASTILVGTLVATATPVLADPVAPPAPPAAPQPPEAPDAPQPPAPPAPPAHPDGIHTIDISNDNGVHVTRIRRDNGTTIVLRTDRRLSDDEIADHVREAEQSRAETERDAAETERDAAEAAREARRHRETSRVMIRRHRESIPSEAEIAAIIDNARSEARAAARDAGRAHADAARAQAEANRIHIDVRRIEADARREAHRALRRAHAARIIDCRDGDAARRVVERTGEVDGEARSLRIVTCTDGSPALQLEAMRSARRALAEMEDTVVLATEHRASALAELDEEIADLEREIADRQN